MGIDKTLELPFKRMQSNMKPTLTVALKIVSIETLQALYIKYLMQDCRMSLNCANEAG